MMLGLLLARAGVEVAVHEKHGDFLRDFRGDTLHPSTLEVIAELGLIDRLLALPHDRVPVISAYLGSREVRVADFSRLPVRCPFIAMMPQWDFLNFLASEARRYPSFTLHMDSEIRALEALRADLIVGADGRHSTVRRLAGLEVLELGAPIDVLWFRLSRRPGDPGESMGRFQPGAIFVLINRRDYWQCGYVIPKGAAEAIRADGLAKLRSTIARIIDFAADRVDEIVDWDQVKLLTVQIDRLKRWHKAGVLCIGDAAHAMSPIGGVGINLAIQDAVAAANILAEPLLRGTLGTEHLEAVQRRREWPVRVTQRIQIVAQDRIISRVLRSRGTLEPPLFVRLLSRSPRLQGLPGRLIGMGIRPEHVRTSAAAPERARPGTTG